MTNSLVAEASILGGATELEELDCAHVVCVRHQADLRAPVIAVVGDSIARSLDLGLAEHAQRQGWTYVTASAGGCRVTHLLTMDGDPTTDKTRCYETTQELHRELLSEHSPDVVIVAANMELTDFAGDHAVRVRSGSPAWRTTEARELRRVVDRFVVAGSSVVLVASAPRVIPDGCLRDDHIDLPGCSVSAGGDHLAAQYNAILQRVASDSPRDVFVVSPTPHLCPRGICSPKVNGILVLYDGRHYSRAGSRWIVPRLFKDMQSLGALPQALHRTGPPPKGDLKNGCQACRRRSYPLDSVTSLRSG